MSMAAAPIMAKQIMTCNECGNKVDALKYGDHVNSDHKLFIEGAVPVSTGQQDLQVLTCDACGAVVDAMKYADHVKSDHKLYTINIKGVGAQMVPPQPAMRRPVKFLDIPYLGRVRADAFLIWTLFMLILGVIMGAGYLR